MRVDLELDELRESCAGEREPVTMYSYIVRSVKTNGGGFVQHGSGPNWEGGYITLCTCKHRMRSCLSSDSWEGVWAAGVTGKPRHELVYLMKIGWAFDSHLELWRCRGLPKGMKDAKAAHRNRLGDLFCPNGRPLDPYRTRSYKPPIDGHSHEAGWKNDIDYRGFRRRRAALLVGDPEQTFIWRKPHLYTSRSHYRGHSRWTLQEFLRTLSAVWP